jgi:hypothetical protein
MITRKLKFFRFSRVINLSSILIVFFFFFLKVSWKALLISVLNAVEIRSRVSEREKKKEVVYLLHKEKVKII